MKKQIQSEPLKKALKSIEDISEKEKEGGKAKDALVVMTAVEKIDDNVKESLKKLDYKDLEYFYFAPYPLLAIFTFIIFAAQM